MLPVWIVILCLNGAWAESLQNSPAESAKPFWKAKEKVYKRIKDGEVIVVVKAVPSEPPATMKHHLVVQGGGHVSAPAAFVFKKALDFDNLAKVSGYIKSAKYDPKSELLELTVGAFGHEGKMKLKLKTKEDEVPRRIDYLVVGGPMQGLTGTFLFSELKAKKTEVGINSDFHYDKFPVPKMFLEFGMEVAFQRMALRLRSYVEDEFRESDGGNP